MSRRNTMQMVAVALAMVMLNGRIGTAAETAPNEAATPPQTALATSSGRQVFWRGEQVGLSLVAPLAAPGEAVVTLAAAGQAGVPIYRGKLSPVAGVARLHLLLPTERLGDGTYTATAQIGDARAVVTFIVRETTVATPGMVINELGIAPQARQVSQTAQIDFMNDLFTGEKGPDTAGDLRKFDALADAGMLYWTQDATRPFSFMPPHSSPATDGEYRRRLVLGNTVRMRYPAFAGQVFDYDPTGYWVDDGVYNFLVSVWGWGNLGPQLKQYLATQERALLDTFKKETGFEGMNAEAVMRLAVAVRSPESMGYMDQPTRRWAEEIAARSPAPDAAELARLKERGFAW